MSRRDAVLTTGLVLLTMSALSCRPSTDATPVATPAMPVPLNPEPDPAVQFIVPYTTDTAQIDEWLKVRDRCIYLTPEEVQYLLRTRAAEKIPDSQLNVPHLLDRYSIPTHDDKWALVVWKTFDHQGFIFPSGNAFAVDSQPGPDYFSTRFILLSAFDDPPPDPGEPH